MIFVPSRNRRPMLERFFEVSKPQMDGRVLIDDDDNSYDGMRLPRGWEFFQQPRDSTVKILNRAYRRWPDEPFYGQIGDDYICKPDGWDVMLSDAASYNHIAWGNDGRWGERLCTSFFVGGTIVRMFDWFAHPSFEHLYVDTVWWMIAKGAGISKYRPEIHTTHINVKDQTYRERRVSRDQVTFDKLRGEAIGELIDLAAKLK